MTDTAFTAHDIAAFLQEHPGFFDEHAEVFATLQVPHPHGSRAISLGERQIMTLRERSRELEWRMNELVRNASASESIGAHIAKWCCRLLSESEPQRVPGEIALGLAEQFDLNHVALRLWNLSGQPDNGYGEPVSADLRAFADSLKAPYCGTDTGFGPWPGWTPSPSRWPWCRCAWRPTAPAWASWCWVRTTPNASARTWAPPSWNPSAGWPRRPCTAWNRPRPGLAPPSGRDG